MQRENIDTESATVSRHAWIPSIQEWVRPTEKMLLGGWSEATYRLVGVPPPQKGAQPGRKEFRDNGNFKELIPLSSW